MLASFISGLPTPALVAIIILVIGLPVVLVTEAKNRSKGITPAPADLIAAGKAKDWAKHNEQHTPTFTRPRKELASSPHARLLAPSFPYALCHKNPVDALALSDPDADAEMIRRDWGITNRSDLLVHVYALLRAGHRNTYGLLRRRCAKPALVDHMLAQVDKGAAYSQEAREKRWQIERLLANDRGIQSVQFDAWDFIRAAMLTRIGAGLGWLSEDEAWDTLSVITRALQRTYSSWDEAWEAFRITRWFWAAEGQAQEAANDLHDRNRGEFLVGKNGLWTAIPWDAPYPEPRFILLDAVMEVDKLRCLTSAERKDATAWDLELDGQTHAQLGFTLP